VWSEDYEALSAYEKGEYRRIANHLLAHTYLTKYSYQPAKQMTLPNRDYQIASRFYDLFKEYFSVAGWQLENDNIYGFMSLINIHDNNRFRMDQFTTLFLYTCRLIYEEQREQASSFHTVPTSTSDVVQKMDALGLLKNGKTTQKERIEAQRTLAHFRLIEKMETTAWDPEGNRILILPSILAVITNQGINDIILELEDLKMEPDGGEEDLSDPGGETDDTQSLGVYNA